MPRIYPPSFAQSPEGDIYVARGDRNVQRWDGLLGAFVDAGVPAPSAALSLAANASGGTIVGDIWAYTRFVDSRGNVSNLSPVSSKLSIAVSSKTITGATNASPIVITAAAHGFSNGDTIKVEGVLGNWGANGTWVIANKTTDTFELAESIGTGTYASGGTAKKGTAQIDYTSVPTTTDTRVAKKQILRNKDGDTSVFYVDVETTDLADTTLSSTNTDDDLTTAVPLLDTQGRDLHVSTHAEPPNWKRFAAFLKGRLWLAGQLEYREGGISVTNGSPTVTGLQTNWTSAMDGWELFPLGTSNTQSYTIGSLNTSTQTITLDENYAGSTEAFLHYALVPPLLNSNGGAERRTIYFSSAGIPESFCLARSLTLEERDQGEITGLIPFETTLLVACERAMYRLIYRTRPESDGYVTEIARRGMPNNNCWVLLDRTLFALDRRGVWASTGDAVQDVSESIRGVFDGSASRKINWNCTEYFFAVADPERSVLRWFVVMDGGKYPRHALCFCLRTTRWWIEEYPQPVAAGCVSCGDGRQRSYVGLPSRRVAALAETSGDAVAANTTSTLKSTATAGALLTLTDSAAAFTADVVGAPLRIVEGTGAGQQRTIISRTATVLTVDRPWMTVPDTTSKYQIGGVPWTWRCGSLRWSPSKADARRSVEVLYQPTTRETATALRRFVSYDAVPTNHAADYEANAVRTVDGLPEAWIDTTDSNGLVRQEFTDQQQPLLHGRETMQVELTGVTNHERMKIYEVVAEGAMR